MSTQVNTYVILAIELPYKQVDEAKIEAYRDSAFNPPRSFSEPTVLFDGMNGEYVYLGYVHARSEEGADFDKTVTLPRITRARKRAMVQALVRLGRDILGDPEAEFRCCWRIVPHYR